MQPACNHMNQKILAPAMFERGTKTTPASRPSSRSVQTRSSLGPGGGPKQTAKVGHFIMPESSLRLQPIYLLHLKLSPDIAGI
jgi:hypothetical protein